jgi:serine/threonine protein kinase/tetratricopeptide (TPR) repeat protein
MPAEKSHEAPVCEQCAVPLPGQAVGGLCASCLLKLALDPPAEPTEMAGDSGSASAEPVHVHCFGDDEPGEMISDQPAAPPQEAAGSRIGHYQLLKIIGEGGFGTVWMAEQSEPVQRRVALKIIRIGMDTREFIARFEQERQALAMMDHPNIAKVHDAGATDSGRPFFVMELVQGVPITKFCDQQKLPLPARLELFIEVCRAIQHAHQKGIIHRDIKPSNVMVALDGDKPVPKIIDFGIAKATQGKLTDETVFTRFEQFIGTPVYMSPEQAAMVPDIDTRSDIYALGVLLYELLTGKPPFDAKSLVSAGYEEMRRMIREVEPPKPSSKLGTLSADERTTLANARQIEPAKLSRSVEPDLDWIVMKAIDKDRSRRYETVNGLALDLQRFLANEPVSATPPSAAYKFRKFARRNKAALSMGAGIAAVLVGATIVSMWQAVRATNAEKVATEARELADARLAEKDTALKDAEGISAFLGEVFESPDPVRNGRAVTVVDALARAAKKLEAGLASQPGRRARLQAALGRTYLTLGMPREAIPLQEKARDYYRATFGLRHDYTLQTMHELANCYHEADRRDEALKLAEEVLTLRREFNGPEHPAAIAAMHSLATSWHYAGRRDEALKMREEVLALRRKVDGPEHADTLGAMHNLARSFRDAGRLEEALKLREELLALCRKVLNPEHPQTIAAMANLASSYNAAGRWKDALTLDEEALSLSRNVLGPTHRNTLDAMVNLARTYDRAGRSQEALKLRGEALPLHCDVIGQEHPLTLDVMYDLALSYYYANRMDEGIELGKELVRLRQKVLGPEDPETIGAMSNLMICYKDSDRHDEAITLGEQVLALSRKVNGPEHRDTLGMSDNLARCYHNNRRTDDAIRLGEETLRLHLEVYGVEHADTIGTKLNLALYYQNAGRLEEAIKLGEEILPLSRRLNGPEDRQTLAAMNDLALSYDEAGRDDEALKLKEETLTLIQKVFGPENDRTFKAMFNLALSYDKAGRKPEALALKEAVFTGRHKLLGPVHLLTLKAMSSLADALEDAGRKEEALKLMEEALPLCRKHLGDDSPETLGVMTNLTGFYAAIGRADEAIKLGEELLPLRNKVSGPEHVNTLIAMRNLSTAYGGAGRWNESLMLTEELLTLSRKVNGPDSRQALTVMGDLAIAYSAAGRDKDVLKLREEVLTLSRKVNGPEDPDTLLAVSNLSLSYSNAGRLKEAIKLQEESMDAVRRVLTQHHRYRAIALQNMAELYELAGRKKEAAAFRKELAEARNASSPAPEPAITAAAKPTSPGDLPPVQNTLVAPNAEWKWLHPTGGQDPADTAPAFHNSFFRSDFDDSAWQTGRDSDKPDAGFGYGLSFKGVSIGKPEELKHGKTAWFRHQFTTGKMHNHLEFRCHRDDGIIVYLDGKEVIRDNVAPGADSWLLPAVKAMDRENDNVIHRHAIPGSLAPGSHILAISVHNTAQPSTDLRLGGVTLVELKPAAAGK